MDKEIELAIVVILFSFGVVFFLGLSLGYEFARELVAEWCMRTGSGTAYMLNDYLRGKEWILLASFIIYFTAFFPIIIYLMKRWKPKVEKK